MNKKEFTEWVLDWDRSKGAQITFELNDGFKYTIKILTGSSVIANGEVISHRKDETLVSEIWDAMISALILSTVDVSFSNF